MPSWNAMHGLNAAKEVFTGNPIKYLCHFRELHDLAATSPDICSVTLSTLDSPDVELEHSPRGLADASFIRRMKEIHGENSPWWNANILGKFPGSDSVRFLPNSWLNACALPSVLTDPCWIEAPEGRVRMGVDPGGGVGADPSVIVVRNDKRLLEVWASSKHGLLEDAEHRLEPVVIAKAKQWKVSGSDVTFDKNGLGRSLGNYLAKHGLEGALGYFGGGRGGKFYFNRRTACGFGVRDRLDPHRKGHVPFYTGGVPGWAQLQEQLSELRSPTMEFDEGTVKQALETKEEMSARIRRSPDELDAFLMTFATRG
jgi:hypothetical protein